MGERAVPAPALGLKKKTRLLSETYKSTTKLHKFHRRLCSPRVGSLKRKPRDKDRVQVAYSVSGTKKHKSVGGEGTTERREKSMQGTTDGNCENHFYVST